MDLVSVHQTTLHYFFLLFQGTGATEAKRIVSFTENKKKYSMFNQIKQSRKGLVARNVVHLQLLK